MNSPPDGSIALREIAHARSGDKGDHANVGVIAFTPSGYEFLVSELTVERVQAFFDLLPVERTERFEMANIHALNFLLYNALSGGASRSPRIDTQDKLLAPAILDMRLPRPDNLVEMQ